jgi:hypothetical protein
MTTGKEDDHGKDNGSKNKGNDGVSASGGQGRLLVAGASIGRHR